MYKYVGKREDAENLRGAELQMCFYLVVVVNSCLCVWIYLDVFKSVCL